MFRTRFFFNWHKYPGNCCFKNELFFIKISNNIVDQLYVVFNAGLDSLSTMGKLKFLDPTVWWLHSIERDWCMAIVNSLVLLMISFWKKLQFFILIEWTLLRIWASKLSTKLRIQICFWAEALFHFSISTWKF